MGITNIQKYQEIPVLNTHESTLPGPNEGRIQPRSIVEDTYPFKLSRNSTLTDFLYQNKLQSERIAEQTPEIFDMNAQGQSPHTLWIGCSDSRISESCLGVAPGEIFTLRNIANIVSSNDVSTMGAIQFAIEVLKVKRVIVCGHTDCGGIWASLSSKKIGGVLDHWLNPIRHVRAHNLKRLASVSDPREKCATLAELNVISSVHALKRHPSFTDAYKKGDIEVYGLIYNVGTGLLHEIEIPVDDEFETVFDFSDESDDHASH
ncbi:unnamed protein product [Kuraishia capsulata CBS 1993]|uniref:Carbonic anhydrase n=1 Tax=Kuraishia capsulata CBS 1993 TaxID=1382522 RepID=W6MXA1_9ASCO|nr:uncharacterized protein KUCA_T00004513001 [Kuraishia capsulata CBS 1993]CDK28530.1 unnamed protein product [Kuraishia capsulata CBS 1993]